MIKIFASFIFSFMLLGLTLAPTIISLIDSDLELSIFVDSEEEQESKEGKEGKESQKDIKVRMSQDFDDLFQFQDHYSKSIFDFHNKLYSSKHKELNSPPPEHYIL